MQNGINKTPTIPKKYKLEGNDRETQDTDNRLAGQI